MKKFLLENTPIVYYIDDVAGAKRDWIVFLHPAFSDHRIFERQFKFFSGKYNLIAIDLLGHGESTNAKKGDDITKTSEWLYGIFEKQSIASAHIVGVSLGAVLAQDFAERYEDKILSLALFGGYDINNFDEKMAKKNSAKQFGMILKGFVSIKWFAKANKKISAYTEKGQEEFYKLNLGFQKKSFMYLSKLNLLVNKKTQPLARPYPMLIGCGEYDVDGAIKIVNEWAEREGLEKIIFAGAGHCVNLDRPEEFNTALENFLKTYEKDN